MEGLKERVARNLVLCRKGAGLTQLQVAEHLNYSDKAVSKWERGEGLPDLTVLVALSELYGVTLDYFVQEHEGKRLPLPKDKRRRLIYVLCACGLVWLVATLVFVFLGIFGVQGKTWLAFVFAAPATFVLLTVFSCLWGNRAEIFFAVSGIVWMTALSLFLSWETENIWLVFIAAIPLEVLALFWFILRPKKGK